MKAVDAVKKLESFIHQPRKKLPWLKGRESLLDCAAAVSYILDVKPEIISCGVFVDYFKHRKAWFVVGVPLPGDCVVFDWETGKGMGLGNINHDHIGIVVKADKKGVTYVSADSTRPTPGLVTDNFVGYKFVLGYGRPSYVKGK